MRVALQSLVHVDPEMIDEPVGKAVLDPLMAQAGKGVDQARDEVTRHEVLG